MDYDIYSSIGDDYRHSTLESVSVVIALLLSPLLVIGGVSLVANILMSW